MNENADLTSADPDGLTSIHYACMSGNKIIAKTVCEKAPDMINDRDSQGVTSALIASEMGHDKILQLLVSKGADATLCDNQNRNCLHVASCAGRLSTVKYLLGLERFNINCRGGRFKQTPVMMAVLNGHDEVYNRLVCEEADLSLCDTNNRDCLMLASEGGHTSIVANLLSMNTFDINRKRKWDEQTAVMLAAKGGHFDVYNLLVTKEADLSKSDLFNSDCLVWACIGGNVKIVRHLLSMELFDINERYRLKLTPIMHAVYSGHYEVLISWWKMELICLLKMLKTKTALYGHAREVTHQ
ncbi:ankyrin repeat domain-containing protein 17-like [Haliotis rubra]|uniref:ankyrin repeat domain-containing protein 17-like n=1 Tax=Haliotis rubra TaxID=36100 RepID=UPI001EE5CA68|nr:ankyrin repeat domain-containing protein 17-like [Haliotis rubra]